MMSNAKQLPFNKEAEMSVLGAIFIDPEAFFEISGKLYAEDFYTKHHQELYTAMGDLAADKRLDLVELKTELESRGSLNAIGGIEYIVELANFVPTSAGIERYARIVKECAVRRRMISGYSRALQDLYDPTKSVGSVTDFVQEDILAGAEKPKNISNFSDACNQFFEKLEARAKSGEKYPGIQTGFMLFDRMTGGVEKGKLYVIGGRPGMGKSAFALNIAANIAKDDKTVMYFSLEMEQDEVMKRIMSYLSRVKSGRLKTASLTDDEYVELAKASEKIKSDNLMIDDSAYQTIGSITSTCIKVNGQLRNSGRRIDCIVIDHLHLMSSSSRTIDRRFQIGEITRGTKLLAKRLECPVILLSQLSRAGKDKKDVRPTLSDLRESGDIEQDADVVAFVHREEYYKPTVENEGHADLILAKVRDGETGTVELGWDKTTTTFMSLHEYLKMKNKDKESENEL